MLKFAVGPSQDVSGLLQGSMVGADETGWEVNVGTTVGDAATKSTAVGEGTGVSVGSGVFVGGMAVLVGTAACVSATIVDAIETAVDCTASALRVGSAGVFPHALSNRLSMTIPAHVFFFIMT